MDGAAGGAADAWEEGGDEGLGRRSDSSGASGRNRNTAFLQARRSECPCRGIPLGRVLCAKRDSLVCNVRAGSGARVAAAGSIWPQEEASRPLSEGAGKNRASVEVAETTSGHNRGLSADAHSFFEMLEVARTEKAPRNGL